MRTMMFTRLHTLARGPALVQLLLPATFKEGSGREP